ncbi:MAG: metallophosphoesterase [Bacteroidetes bacterium]|nr:metallophosphoesterase [Bacteroidota bacterium]
MIKILFLSDTHLGHEYPIRATKRIRRGQDFFDNFEFVLNYAIEHKIDLILHGGDFFFRTKIPEAIISKSYKILYDFAKHNIPLVIVPGNHESSRLPRSPLIFQPNLHIFKEACCFHFEIKGKKINISGFPYERHQIRDQFHDIAQQIKKQEAEADINLLLTHHAVEGCTCGPGNYTFRKNEDVIQMKDIPMHYDAVLCGHIHREQILWKNEQNKKLPIIYAGSVERTSFAEKEEIKGFYVLEFDEKKQNRNFVPLNTRPMVDISIPENLNSAIDLVNYLLDESKSLDSRSILKIKCTNEEIRKLLTPKLLDEVFKPSIITQISGWNQEFKQRKKKEKTPNLFDL